MASNNSARNRQKPVSAVDPIWDHVQREARAALDSDVAVAAFMMEAVLNHETLEQVIAERIAHRLHGEGLRADVIRRAFADMSASSDIYASRLRSDLAAVFDRDPACERYLEPVLYFKGFHALQAHRLAHWLWRNGRRDLALFLQSASSSKFQVDIHPAVPMGSGIFMDHATGIVIGMTATIGDNVSILQGVTLGGTGKEDGDRHPKVSNGVLIGAGAQVLGNIRIGCCSRVAAGSVVLKDVPDETTVAGVPAKIVGEAGCSEPARSMDHMLGS